MVKFEALTAALAALRSDKPEEAKAITIKNEGYAMEPSHPLMKRAWVGDESTKPVAPLSDDFYKFLTPDEVQQYAHGDIIKHRQVGIDKGSNLAAAYQVVYRSENSTGQPVGALTTILIPTNNDNEHVVVYPQAEDSSFINCASSYGYLNNGLDASVNDLLNKGWVVNIPDHEGFNSSFVAGILEGKLTLDSIRAFQKARDLTGVQNDVYAVTGYSGGSIATGWAAELQPTYAPELNIVGFTMGGYVTDPVAVMKHVNKSPTVGFVPAGIMGLASEYPEMWDVFAEEMKPELASQFMNALKQCTLGDILQFFSQDMFNYFKSGEGIFDNKIIAKVTSDNTLAKAVPQAPMFVYNGLSDEIVPYQIVDSTVDFYCGQGGNVVYNRLKGHGHLDTSSDQWSNVVDFIGKVFNGDTPKGCSFEGVVPDFASKYNSTSATTSAAPETSGVNTTVSASDLPAEPTNPTADVTTVPSFPQNDTTELSFCDSDSATPSASPSTSEDPYCDEQTVTTVVTAYTTVCPEDTTISAGSTIITATKGQTVTVTDCPCTLTTVQSSAPQKSNADNGNGGQTAQQKPSKGAGSNPGSESGSDGKPGSGSGSGSGAKPGSGAGSSGSQAGSKPGSGPGKSAHPVQPIEVPTGTDVAAANAASILSPLSGLIAMMLLV